MSRAQPVGHSSRCPCARVLSGSVLVLGCYLAVTQAAIAAPEHRIFIGSLDKSNDLDLQKELVRELERSGAFQVVSSPARADVVLSGTTELYVRGYYSLYVRAGSAPGRGRPLFAGFASVELKNASGEIVWSYLSTLREATTNPSRELSNDIAKHLLQAKLPASNTQ